MGIKNLSKVMKQKKVNFRNKPLSAYQNKVIAIDISMYLYSFYNAQGQIFTGLFHQIECLLKNGIIPFYVFDGKSPGLKKATVKKRKDVQKQNKNHSEKLARENPELVEEIMKYSKRSFELNDKIISWCKQMFDCYGIPYTVAQGEADKLCASLVMQGIAHACLSNDSDMFAYGCPILLKNLKKGFVEEYRLDDIINGLQLESKADFLTLCVLMGTDYYPNIRNIGPAKAQQLVQKFHTLDVIFYHVNNDKEFEKINLTEESQKTYFEIYTLFDESLPLFNFPKPCLKNVDIENAEKWTAEQFDTKRYCSEHIVNKQMNSTTRMNNTIFRMKKMLGKEAKPPKTIDFFFKD